ncbi:hypothetical protein HNQ59_002701 [Chitinivorax tropicus]|uniref:Uncharacterized protein n=1 Tax=Chitinivorax tropicus TaxID=714531 RepID=A0A840MLW4_9PROT|nr:hypothetical protein [Chitinivorax tropicus]
MALLAFAIVELEMRTALKGAGRRTGFVPETRAAMWGNVDRSFAAPSGAGLDVTWGVNVNQACASIDDINQGVG